MTSQFVTIAAALALAQTNAEPATEELGAHELAYPFPSPDGREVLFQGNFDGRWQLYSMALEDGKLRRVHISNKDDTQPAFSPDGRKIAFISNRDGNDEVYVLDVGTGTVRSIAPHPGKDGHPKWSAAGDWIVFNRTFDPADRTGDKDSAILRVRPDGSGLEVISDSPQIETFASLSPDGRSVAFVEWFPDEAGTPARNGEIVVVDIATKERRNVTNTPAFDGYPFWAPQDGWIYYSAPAEGPSGREAVVYRIRADGSGRDRLTDLDGRSEVRAIPSADKKFLYFNVGDSKRVLLIRKPLPDTKDQPPTATPAGERGSL